MVRGVSESKTARSSMKRRREASQVKKSPVQWRGVRTKRRKTPPSRNERIVIDLTDITDDDSEEDIGGRSVEFLLDDYEISASSAESSTSSVNSSTSTIDGHSYDDSSSSSDSGSEDIIFVSENTHGPSERATRPSYFDRILGMVTSGANRRYQTRGTNSMRTTVESPTPWITEEEENHARSGKTIAFECPVCLTEMDTENVSSTTCGHVFCTSCLEKSISIKSVCPVCRKRLNRKSIRKLFLGSKVE